VSSGLLWRVHKPKHPVNFLFGTIHVDDKRVKALNPQIKRRFDESKTLCLEILPDRENQVGIGLAMLLPQDQFLDDIVGDPLFVRLSLHLNKKGMTPLAAVHLKPWAAMIALSRPESQGGYALDEQLYHWGIHQYKELCALETLQEQLSIFDQLSQVDQVALLRDTLDHLPMVHEMNEQLINAYLAGNLDEIYRRSIEIEGGSELSLRLRKKLIDDRNQKMAKRLTSTLEKGRAFVAVGALHLPGKEGLIHLLRQQGFVVTPPDMPLSPW
jgi:uncharacterized protein YbaP (TraB family)